MEPAVAGLTEEPKARRRPFFRRRHFLIDRKGQLLTTAKIAGVVLALLVLLNLVFSLWSTIETQAILASNPQLFEEMTAIDRRGALVLGIVSLVVLAAVVVRSIRLTHRTAGASFNVHRCLAKVAAGEYDTELRVRSKDNLRELQDPFNQMTASLRKEAIKDHAALSSLAGRIEELGHVELAEEVRDLAEAKAKLADPTS
jgi:nitrogen fixation/metabolism regulation signal transduction histidine kinase